MSSAPSARRTARALEQDERAGIPRDRGADVGRSGGASLRAADAELRASMLYESGYWCGEAVVKTVNEVAGHPFPPGVMRLASGFCEGFGGSRCTCGALAGAVMASGMLAGRDGPDDDWRPSYDAAGELRRRFVAEQDAATCDEIVHRIGGMHLPQRWAHCSELVGRCTRWVVEIAEQEAWLATER